MRSEQAIRKLRSIMDTQTPYNITRGGITITVTKNVYPTSELSELIVEALDDKQYGITGGEDVLDYGSGTGFLAVSAALRRTKSVTAIDISPDAIACGKANAEAHKVLHKITFVESENLSGLGKARAAFDVIMAGMPWDDAEAHSILERSMFDPGFTMRKSLFSHAKRLLKPRGRIILSSRYGHETDYPEAYPEGFTYVVAKKRNIKDVTHTAIVATLAD